MNEFAINIKYLNKTFGDFKAVNNLDFYVEKAECFGLLGPNGAGKTTSMKMLYGKVKPDADDKTIMDVLGYSSFKD